MRSQQAHAYRVHVTCPWCQSQLQVMVTLGFTNGRSPNYGRRTKITTRRGLGVEHECIAPMAAQAGP